MSSLRGARTRGQRPHGLVLYEGPSQIDGQPIAAIATGLRRRSANAKTGNMVQVWIIRSDIHPVEAVQDGSDRSICGDCRLRAGGCYVRVEQAPRAVFDAYQRGLYDQFDALKHLDLIQGWVVRLGAYGDPAAVPYRVWKTVTKSAAGHTSYSHQWRDGRFWRLRRWCMASVHSRAEAREALARGWRTFRTSMPGEPPRRGEVRCPASAESGKRTTCERCGLCNGTDDTSRRPNVVIARHGSAAVIGTYDRRFGS